MMTGAIGDTMTGMGNPGAMARESGILRMRGLPFAATENDVHDFFVGFAIGAEGVHLLRNATGRPSGEGYVEFMTTEEAERAMATRNRERMMHRYIELFRASRNEMQFAIARSNSFIQLLPHHPAGHFAHHQQQQQQQQYQYQYQQQQQQQQGRQVWHQAMMMMMPSIPAQQQPQGFVQPNQSWGFPAVIPTMTIAVQPQSAMIPQQRPTMEQLVAGRCVVRMSGMPFSATVEDIIEFFRGYVLVPTHSSIVLTPDGRSSGQALAVFGTADEAQRAIRDKNRTEMGGRNIELSIAQ